MHAVDRLNPNSARSYEALGNRRESRRLSVMPPADPQPRRSILVGSGGYRKSLIPPTAEIETRESSLSVSVVEPTYEPLSAAADSNPNASASAGPTAVGETDMPIRRKKRVVIIDDTTATDVAGYGGSHTTIDELRRSLATASEAAQDAAAAAAAADAQVGDGGSSAEIAAAAAAAAEAQPRETFALILKRVLTVVALLGFFLLALYFRLCTDVELSSTIGGSPVPHSAPLCLVRPTFTLNQTAVRNWRWSEHRARMRLQFG